MSKNFYHYSKEIIESNEKFAFLKDSVSKIPDIDKSKKESLIAAPLSGFGSKTDDKLTGVKRKQKEKEKKVGAAVVEYIKSSTATNNSKITI